MDAVTNSILKPSSPANNWTALSGTELNRQAVELGPIEYLIEDLIPRASALHLWSGLPDAGKSLCATSLCLSAAMGGLCWGRYQSQAGPILYVDLEQGPMVSRHRIHRLMLGLGIDRADPMFVTYPRAVDVMHGDLDGLARLLQDTEQDTGRKVSLVTLDTLAAVHAVDENTGRMTPVMNRCRRFAEELECEFLILHHNRKDQLNGFGSSHKVNQRARGHTSIAGAVDTHLDFTRTKGGLIEVTQGKNRLAPKLAPFRLLIEGTREDDWVRIAFDNSVDPSSADNSRRGRALEFVLSFLKEQDLTPKQMLVNEAERRGIAKRTLELALKDLGPLIEREQHGKPAYYRLAKRPDGESQ